jgi:hypothetical protein
MTDDEFNIPAWIRPLSESGMVDLDIEFRKRPRISVIVRSARELDSSSAIVVGLFVAWALTRGLLEESKFAPHATLIQEIKKRKRKGSELVAVALRRGLWDEHLVDRPKLRLTAYRWFHNMCDLWITADLVDVSGRRTSASGHDEPILDDDAWDAVDMATQTLDNRFCRMGQKLI